MAKRSLWKITEYHEDTNLQPQERKFARDIVSQLQACEDPSRFHSPDGRVCEMHNLSGVGGCNFAGFFRFKPSTEMRYGGYNIRIIFRLYCSGEQITVAREMPLRGKDREMRVDRVAQRANAYRALEMEVEVEICKPTPETA